MFMKKNCSLSVIILNELGYLSRFHAGGALLFYVLSRFYGRTGIIITPNLTFAERNSVFIDAEMKPH